MEQLLNYNSIQKNLLFPQLVTPGTVMYSDICIVGGGVAGAALAGYLGKHGLRVTVIEKDMSEQDRIVGELLQPDGVKVLEEMGMASVLDGYDAQTVTGYAIYVNGKHVQVPYPSEKGDVCTGRGLRNGKLIKALRLYANQFPNVKWMEGKVTALDYARDTYAVTGVNYTDEVTGEAFQIKAALTVVSDGFFSSLRSGLSQAEKKVSGFFMGMLLKNGQLPFPNHGHVFVTDQTAFLCYPVTSNEVRILIDFAGQQPPRKGEELTSFLKGHVASSIPQELRPAFLEAVDEGKFKIMPNHYLPANPVHVPGAVLLGDALNMRHPLTGGGMTVAFTDVHNLGRLLVSASESSGDDRWDRAVDIFYKQGRRPNATINILADALYKVFTNPELREACFEYLSRGGMFASGPVSVLSGISRNKSLLTSHFFAVSLYGALATLRKSPSPTGVRKAYSIVGESFHIIQPLIEAEKPGIMVRTALWAGKSIFPVSRFTS